MSNIFDDDPPGGLWDDELDPAPSATPHLRSVRRIPERQTSSVPPDRRDEENAALIDLTQRRPPRDPIGEQDEKHHGRTTRRYALLGALGTVALMAAVALTALAGHPAQRRAPVAGAALQTDTERPAATRKVQQASAAARGQIASPPAREGSRRAHPTPDPFQEARRCLKAGRPPSIDVDASGNPNRDRHRAAHSAVGQSARSACTINPDALGDKRICRPRLRREQRVQL